MEVSIIGNSKRISETNGTCWRRNLAEAQIQFEYTKLENIFFMEKGNLELDLDGPAIHLSLSYDNGSNIFFTHESF